MVLLIAGRDGFVRSTVRVELGQASRNVLLASFDQRQPTMVRGVWA
jgi:hypothetical protein